MLLKCCFERADVVVVEVVKALDNRFKSLVIFGLASGGDGGQGTSVKTGCCREDHRALDVASLVAMFPGQLDRGFIGFSSGITEENAVSAAVLHQPVGQFFLFRNSVQIGYMLDPSKLPVQVPAHHTVAVSQGVSGDSSDGIQVPVPPVIPDPAALPTHEGERKSAVGVHHSVG